MLLTKFRFVAGAAEEVSSNTGSAAAPTHTATTSNRPAQSNTSLPEDLDRDFESDNVEPWERLPPDWSSRGQQDLTLSIALLTPICLDSILELTLDNSIRYTHCTISTAKTIQTRHCQAIKPDRIVQFDLPSPTFGQRLLLLRHMKSMMAW